MASIKALLFDLDGTLVDSAEDLMDALNEVLVGEGLRRVSGAEVRSMIGDGALKLVERGLVETGGDLRRSDELLAIFLKIYEPRSSRKTRPYPGVLDTLGGLRKSGLHLAIVTNKPEVATRLITNALGLTPFFGAVVGGDTLPERKPHRAPVEEALRRLGVGASEALMVGDSCHDVEAAHAAGLKAAVVSYGYAHGDPRGLGADFVIDHFSDLPRAMENLGFVEMGKG